MEHSDDSASSAAPTRHADDEQIKDPEIHTQYVETYGRALLSARGGNESVKWPSGRVMTAATTIAISDALARRNVKTPGALFRALRTVLEISGVNFAELDRRVGELDLSIVALTTLENANIRFVGELVRLSSAEARRLFRSKTTKELGKALASMNLSFGTDVTAWTPPRAMDVNVPTEKITRSSDGCSSGTTPPPPPLSRRTPTSSRG